MVDYNKPFMYKGPYTIVFIGDDLINAFFIVRNSLERIIYRIIKLYENAVFILDQGEFAGAVRSAINRTAPFNEYCNIKIESHSDSQAEKADLIVFCIENKNGSKYAAVEYAEAMGIKTVDLTEREATALAKYLF